MTDIRIVKDERSRLLQPLSPARARLAELILRKLAIADSHRMLLESAAKLREEQGAEARATAALAALDAKEVAAVTQWASQAPSGPAPVCDAAYREQLLAAVRVAAAQSSAARKAETDINAAANREAIAVKQLEPQFALAIAEILVEEAGPLLAEFDTTNKALAAMAGRIAECAETITTIAHASGPFDTMRPAFQALEKLNERIRIAFARPAPPSGGSDRAAWASFAARLGTDPIAELKVD